MASSKLFLLSGGFAILAFLLFVVLLRMVSAVATAGEGVIVKKTFRPASVYTQVPVGVGRGMRTSSEIPIAESYVFEIRADGLDENVFCDLNTVASRPFEVGDRVRITYRRRGVPFAAKKYLVLDMQPVRPLRQ